MPKYRTYCIPSDFFEHIQNTGNSTMIVNSCQSTLKTGNWLCIFQTAKNIGFFDRFGLQCTSYTPQIKNFIEQSRKFIIQNWMRVQDLSTKSSGFHEPLYFIRILFYCIFLSSFVDNTRLNDFIVENTLSYLYNIDFRALRINCFQNDCKFIY